MIRLPLDAPVMRAPWKVPKAPAPPVPAADAPPAAKPKGRKLKAPPLDVEALQVEAIVVIDSGSHVPEQGAAVVVANGSNVPAPPPKEEVEIVNNGTHVPIPLPFQPVSPLEVLASSNPQVLTVMLRQLRDMKGSQPDTSNGVLKVMTGLATGFRTGQDVTPLMDEVSMHLTGRMDRRELMAELTDVLDDERLIEIFHTRAKFEDFLHGCQRRSDVTIEEGIAIQAYFNNELAKIFGQRGKRSASDMSSGREPHELVTKANLPTQLHRKMLQNKFDEASPQEREILRKLGFKVQQNLVAARLTRTTTETIDLVQGNDSDPKPIE